MKSCTVIREILETTRTHTHTHTYTHTHFLTSTQVTPLAKADQKKLASKTLTNKASTQSACGMREEETQCVCMSLCVEEGGVLRGGRGDRGVGQSRK